MKDKFNDEIWKPITYCSSYLISNYGRVYSNKTCKVLKNHVNNKGYLYNTLLINKTKKNFLNHQLVAIHFIQNKDNKPLINHINGNKKDNRIDNLEWVTPSENIRHAYENRLIISNLPYYGPGEGHPKSKRIKYKFPSGKTKLYGSITKASINNNVSIGSISNNLRGLSKYCGNNLKFNYE